MNIPEHLDYAPQSTPCRTRRSVRDALVIIGCLHLALLAMNLADGLVCDAFHIIYPDWVVTISKLIVIPCVLLTPLFVLVEIALWIFHPRRFPPWIPLGQAFIIGCMVIYAAAHWGP